LDFSHVTVFGVIEFWPIDPGATQSNRNALTANFLRHVNVPPANVHVLGGDTPAGDLPAHCAAFEQAICDAGGIDLMILGVGPGGHLGGNLPGSPADSRTRAVRLGRRCRRYAAADFFGEENVPEQAVTMGVATVMEAREICLLAYGENKAPLVARAVEDEPSEQLPASALQGHPNATLFVDVPASAGLTRIDTPWLLGPCQWDDALARHATVWLARKLAKPLLRLTDEDYVENGLAELRARAGGAHQANRAVFDRLMGTLTDRPAGDAPRRVLVFSPHPDDDVISMGGTLARLARQHHEVHVAYMVSGFLSVFDHDVARYAEFVRQFNGIFALTPEQSIAIEKHIEHFLRGKKPGDVDSPEVQAIKGLIRRTEAVDAARFCGVGSDRVHFLDLPFYNTGKVQKLNLGPDDIAAVSSVLAEVRPEVVFAAGDLSDPHGTHRLCLEAVLSALDRHAAAGADRPELWLYRGAWQEWPPEQIDIAVPLSPDELRHKRFAIFRHQSQKDRAMFPGGFDSREFWQRAEERNLATAALYDALGLPEYHAIEAFVRWPRPRPAHVEAQLTRLPDLPDRADRA